MPADILVMKKRGQKVEVKITPKMRNGYSPSSYAIVVNLKNPNDLALFLHDLEDLQNAPVKKAIEIYNSGKMKVWPF